MLGYFLATLIGLSLGMLGGGGSILTVPILVYVLKVDPKTSIALSLGIVGLTSVFGSIGHLKQKNVDFKVALIFAPFAMIGTVVGSQMSKFLSSNTQLLFFSIVMILASFMMLKERKNTSESSAEIKKSILIVIAVIVGVITGIVGVGGGFLIVPALVILGRVSMKKAVGTSLFVIFLNSTVGFISYLEQVSVDWKFFSLFSFFSIIGVFIGARTVQYIPQKVLKKSFAIFLITMGFFVLYKNLAI
ncbi:sulfite exporter TauE/SafE family protein [Halobacteriovorax sp. HLS]|uniref:sulfite exporter TauE/SafE family protein n=1 Tax=Halobacteriovorax sp. HLS TaxID=2234000 RepID=UPI000FD96E2B|nr:sulfite exporter TauE/SafE family protein [Halobacteriovorax sp. HLS]